MERKIQIYSTNCIIFCAVFRQIQYALLICFIYFELWQPPSANYILTVLYTTDVICGV